MASHAAVGCGCLGPSTALHLHLHLALHKVPACDSPAVKDAKSNPFIEQTSPHPHLVAKGSLRTYCLTDSFE